MRLKSILVGILFLFYFGVSFASETGPLGWPGIPYRRLPSHFEAIGTAYAGKNKTHSPLWFTVASKTAGQIFYPSPDQPQIDSIEVLITDGKSLFLDQRRDTLSTVTYLDDGMTVRILGESRLGLYHFEQLLVSDPGSATLKIHTEFTWKEAGLRVFVLFKPILNLSPSTNIGLATPEGLIATDLHASEPIYATLTASKPWINPSVGFQGFSDGWQELSQNYFLSGKWPQAGPGQIALAGEIRVEPGSHFEFDLSLSLGRSMSEALTLAQLSLETPFSETQAEYEQGWNHYLETLRASHPVTQRILSESTDVSRSAVLLKMHEAKNHPGALFATLGMHSLNPKELYRQAMALLAAGDLVTPVATLDYLEFLQNSNGSWSSKYNLLGAALSAPRQYDETAYPILLFWRLVQKGLITPKPSQLQHFLKGAEFIAAHGPLSPEDQWGRKGGYLPQSLAVMIAALKLSARGTHTPHLGELASDWEASLEKWLLDPDHIYRVGVRSKNTHPVVNGEFLQFVRMRLRNAKDPRIQATLHTYLDSKTGLAVSQSSDHGPYLFGRFQQDTQGTRQRETQSLWPELSGEVGLYFVAAEDLEQAGRQLEALTQNTTDAGLLPQQIFRSLKTSGGTEPGVNSELWIGNEVACPWMPAHAETILLYRSIQEGVVFDAPKYP